MKYITIILLAWLSTTYQTGQNLYVCKNAKLSLYSSAPIEDIKAETQSGASVYNASTGELDFSLVISSLQFEKAFMQQHFNSDYMESDKYPRATFKGKILEPVDATKDGTYPVNVKGELTVHGVTRARTIQGSLTVKNGVIIMASEFMVKCGDHRIDIPQILFYHIAESIKVTVSATFFRYQNTPSK